jgi:phosphoribosylformimino-5-aminoimidazole carboxamide ribotide isomerase
MVDLDGAKSGKLMQYELIKRLVAASPLSIQIGGGIRTHADLSALFKAGVAKVVIGSICISQPQLVANWLAEFGSKRIVLALDCRLNSQGVPQVVTHGWQHESNQTLWEVLDQYANAEFILCSDVSLDGTLLGPNISLYQQIQSRYPQLNIIASGGISQLSDVMQIKKIGLHGLVIGKALYENKFNLEEALAC